MKIAFLDYWKYPNSFDSHNNFFLHLLRQIFENVSVSDPEDADVIFSLGFGVDYTRFKDCIRIQYSGENVRPNLKSFDYSLTFDFDDYDGRNFRFPLWMMHIDWFNVGTYGNPEYLLPENYLYGDNEFNVKEKNKFCSIVFGRGVQNRIDAINTLNNYKQVDVYGKYKNCIPLSDGEKQKMDLISICILLFPLASTFFGGLLGWTCRWRLPWSRKPSSSANLRACIPLSAKCIGATLAVTPPYSTRKKSAD